MEDEHRDRQLPHAVQHVRTANAGPPAEDEVTEWLGTGIEHAAEPESAVKPQPAVTETADLKPGRGIRAWLAVLVVAVLLGSLAAVVVRHMAGGPRNGTASDAAARRQAAARNDAAAWVAQQVSQNVMVSCDPVMCASLTAHGFPSRGLLVLGPTSPPPVRTAVVVETATVRDLFGTSLAVAWAPAVLASFGSGPAAITIRVIAPHGTAAYQTALADSLAAEQAAGNALLTDPRTTVPALAGRQLTAGQVDSRLVGALTALAGHLPITIVQFGNTGQGASVGVPLRWADLAESGQAARTPRAEYLRAVRAYLDGMKTSYRPARMVTVILPGGQAVLRVEFTAPSPLAAPGPQGSS